MPKSGHPKSVKLYQLTECMDTSLVGSQAVDLFSRITGQKLTQKDLTPLVIFLVNLVTVLLGVIFVDGRVAEEDKQRLLTTLYRFSLPESNMRQLTHLMIKGVKENQVYKKVNELLKLTDPLSASERLLLIGFGYEMSAANSEMDGRQKKYLEVVAKHLGINPQHLIVLEAGFTHQGNVDLGAVDEAHFLLDPARFHELDTIFIKAASDLLAVLPAKSKHKETQQHKVLSYEELKKFQEYRKQLDNFCHQIFQIIQDCKERGFLPYMLIEEIGKVSHKLQSQRFRLAVLGEFSQGKSTLLNALLGEGIQPVREIPCTGTVTVLKYGTQKRVVCRYKDGREEEIPLNQYQLKATISEDAALSCLSDELAHSEIEEIVFEHPDLELCSSGVEIVDSPGLNEHPDRTAITQKLLKDTDAVIFLTNASRSLTLGERNLLQDLRTQLNYGKANEPANNLFVVGNFMDLVRTEKGREQVQQRIERFVQGQSPIVVGENRVHFISAQAAMDAILKGSEDDYLRAFEGFKQSLEKFLTLERGTLKIKHSITEVKGLIQKGLDGLHQAEDALDGKIKLSEAEKQKILEQIGEASGRDVRIRLLADQLRDQVIEQANEYWNKWIEELDGRLAYKSIEWSSKHSGIWSRDKLAQDYASQFNKDLSAELEIWINEQFKQAILKQPLETLDDAIRQELQTIHSEFQNLIYLLDNEFTNWTFLSENQTDWNLITNNGFWGGFGAIGFGAALVPVVFIAGPILAIIAGLGAGLLGGGGIAIIEESVKEKVFQLGCEQFVNSIDGIVNKLDQMICSVFSERVEIATEAIDKAISVYENLLEQQEKAHQETLEQREAEKVWIFQKRQELEQLYNELEAMLSKYAVVRSHSFAS